MPPINYAWIIFFLDCVKCLMLIPRSIQYPLLSRDVSVCIQSKWVFSQRFISLTLPTEMKTLRLSCDSSTSTAAAGATGKARRRSVLITYMAVNLLIESIPRNYKKISRCGSKLVHRSCSTEDDETEEVERQREEDRGRLGWEGRRGLAVTWPISAVGLLSQ